MKFQYPLLARTIHHQSCFFIFKVNLFIDKDSKKQELKLIWSLANLSLVLFKGKCIFNERMTGQLAFYEITAYGASRFFSRIFCLHRPCHTINFAQSITSILVQIPTSAIWQVAADQRHRNGKIKGCFKDSVVCFPAM